MTDFTLTKDADGIATITWDVVGKSMNVLSLEGWDDLDGCVTDALGDDAVKGIVITSGKDTFAGGMDLNVIAKMKAMSGDDPAAGLMDGLMKSHAILRKIERANLDPKTNKGGKPVACVLPGTALGIGFEIPLACHRIFAADNPKAKIGLPEIMVGIFPGMGGTTRLARKMGAMAASPFLLEGKLSDPKKAKSAGLIDEVSSDPMADARAWVLSATDADIVKPWDAKGYKMPGGTPYHPAGFMTFVGASAMVNGKTQGAFPAAKALLSAVYEGALVPFDTALKIEARWFTHVLMNPSSEAMIRSLFINKEALEKGANRPDAPDQKVSKLGVIGAGMMGAGIAYVSANAGIEVVLIDREQAAADKGKSYSEGILDKGISRKKVTEDKKAEVLSRITATTDLKALEGCDLIVEAVFEDVDVKADMTKAVEAIVGKDCIFATNTSTLPITELAKASARPDQFIGVAEETGLIIPIGKWVAREACRMGLQLASMGLGTPQVAINLSPKQFSDPELVASIAAILTEERLPPSSLELELTESLLLEATEETRQQLIGLKALGVTLAMDDFGTGYSSLSYLKKFPIDVIKIDRSFIKDIPDSQDDIEITAAVIAMARNLHLKVVAEGIETAEQLAFLRHQRCDIGQGYLFDKPIPGSQLINSLRRYPHWL